MWSRRNVRLRFLVDENLPADVAVLLQRAGHEVLDAGTSPFRGATDEALWHLAASEQRVIVTRDLDFPLPLPTEMPAGIIVVRVRSEARLNDIVALVERFTARIDWTTIPGHVTVIEPGRIRQRGLGTLPSRR